MFLIAPLSQINPFRLHAIIDFLIFFSKEKQTSSATFKVYSKIDQNSLKLNLKCGFLLSTLFSHLNRKIEVFLLKVRRSRNKIVEQELLPKTNGQICFLSWRLGNTWNLKSKFKFQIYSFVFGRSYGSIIFVSRSTEVEIRTKLFNLIFFSNFYLIQSPFWLACKPRLSNKPKPLKRRQQPPCTNKVCNKRPSRVLP